MDQPTTDIFTDEQGRCWQKCQGKDMKVGDKARVWECGILAGEEGEIIFIDGSWKLFEFTNWHDGHDGNLGAYWSHPDFPAERKTASDSRFLLCYANFYKFIPSSQAESLPASSKIKVKMRNCKSENEIETKGELEGFRVNDVVFHKDDGFIGIVRGFKDKHLYLNRTGEKNSVYYFTVGFNQQTINKYGVSLICHGGRLEIDQDGKNVVLPPLNSPIVEFVHGTSRIRVQMPNNSVEEIETYNPDIELKTGQIICGEYANEKQTRVVIGFKKEQIYDAVSGDDEKSSCRFWSNMQGFKTCFENLTVVGQGYPVFGEDRKIKIVRVDEDAPQENAVKQSLHTEVLDNDKLAEAQVKPSPYAHLLEAGGEKQTETDDEPLMQMEPWMKTLVLTLKRKISHLFILHGNIFDLVPYSGQHQLLEDFLKQMFDSYDFILRYNISNGLIIEKGDEKKLIDLLGLGQQQKQDPMQQMVQQAAQAMRGGAMAVSPIPQSPMQLFPLLKQKLFDNDKVKVLLLFDYAEALVREEVSSAQKNDFNIITFKQWARDQRISQNGHAIILLARYDVDLDKSLRDTLVGTREIRIPKPDFNGRLAFLKSINNHVLHGADLNALARLTNGLGFKQILEVIKFVKTSDRIFAEIKEKKTQILQQEYGDILNVLNPQYGYETIGGLEQEKSEMQAIIEAMIAGDYRSAPMGVGFFGPPGTGKTILAEAMATHGLMNFVKPENLRGMYVGQSEGKSSRFNYALRDLAPVIVVVDEAELEGSRRASYDSGVSERLFRDRLKIMDDTGLRGKVLFILLTNRPERLDPAMKRPGRMDVKLAFLYPTAKGRESIFRAIAFKHQLSLSVSDFSPFAQHEKVKGYNGADIEQIMLSAYKRAKRRGNDLIAEADLQWAIDDFIPERASQKEIDEMTLAAINHVSSDSLRPENWKEVVQEIQNRWQSSGSENPQAKATIFSPIKLTSDN